MVCRLNKKSVEYCALGIFLVYMPLNIFYLIGLAVTDHSKSSDVKVDSIGKTGKSEIAYPLKIKHLVPNGDNSVDIILTVNREEFVQAIDATLLGSFNGEFTNNPIPINTTFVIDNQNACKGIPDLQYVIYVHSATLNVQRRKNIRWTWASKTLFKRQITSLVFLMGVPDNPEHQHIIDSEQSMYGDIVQGSFRESYKNLTLKGIMGLKWVSQYCKEAAFAIKADDDAFVNIFELISLI